MNHKERVLDALAHRGYDRIPVKHHGTPEVDAMLMEHFGVDTHLGLADALGDDLRGVAATWIGPELRHFPDGTWEGYWGERYAVGRAAFKKARCDACHQMSGEGNAVGPNLATPPKGRTRLDLLKDILEPNAKINKEYQTEVFELRSGNVVAEPR